MPQLRMKRPKRLSQWKWTNSRPVRSRRYARSPGWSHPEILCSRPDGLDPSSSLPPQDFEWSPVWHIWRLFFLWSSRFKRLLTHIAYTLWFAEAQVLMYTVLYRNTTAIHDHVAFSVTTHSSSSQLLLVYRFLYLKHMMWHALCVHVILLLRSAIILCAVPMDSICCPTTITICQ